MKLSIGLFSFFLVSIFLQSCVTKDATSINEFKSLYANTSTGGNFTIPSGNFVNSTKGSVTLYSLSLPSVSFQSEKVSCGIALSTEYVMTMVSPSSKFSYTRLYFQSQPTTSKTYSFVDSEILNSESVRGTFIDLSKNKEWRAYKGNLKVLISETGTIEASLDTAFIQGFPNTTDTSYYYMLGKMYCE